MAVAGRWVFLTSILRDIVHPLSSLARAKDVALREAEFNKLKNLFYVHMVSHRREAVSLLFHAKRAIICDVPRPSTFDHVMAAMRAEVAATPFGQHLSSSRQLAQRLHASPVTISRAVTQLASEGLVEVHPGRGVVALAAANRCVDAPTDFSWQVDILGDRTVDDGGLLHHLRVADAGAVPMAASYPHHSMLPLDALRRSAARAVRRTDAWDRAPVDGMDDLRRWFVEPLNGSRNAEDALISAGGQAALALAVAAVTKPGDPVIVEAPTYLGALGLLRSHGCRPVPTPTDRNGLQVDAVEGLVERTGARVLYCQPTFQNPTGASLAADRRLALLALARRRRMLVIEDDYARHLGHGGATPTPLTVNDPQGHVLYLTSLTKSLAPGVRVGAVVARGPVLARLRAVAAAQQFFVSRTLQEVALDFVTSSAWSRHLRTLSEMLALRCEAVWRAAEELLPDCRLDLRPRGGMHVWVRLPAAIDDYRLVQSAARRGAIISAGGPYFASEPPASYVRITHCAAEDIPSLRLGVQRIAEGLEDERRSPGGVPSDAPADA